jgi:F-type H+-transporting ATPase subunit b
MNLITPDFGIIFWQTITLLFVLIVLGKFAWKPILSMIQEREQTVERALDAADEARKIVAELQANQKQLIEEATIQREKIILEAESAKISILEEASLEAKQLSQRMLEQARLVIAEEQEVAFEKLKDEVVRLSVQVAEKLLEKELEPQNKQEALIYKLMQKSHLN